MKTTMEKAVDAVLDYFRQAGAKGARVTNAKLTPQQRRESAQKAAQARWRAYRQRIAKEEGK